MRGHHDVGGEPAGPVERTEHDHAHWEKRVDAMMVLLSARGHLLVDELRKNIEALPPDAYDRMSYYERWCASIAATLLQRGLVTADELGRKMAEVAKREGAEAALEKP
jgi:Nitrile hydratase beta subunit, N-terminal